jgi:hypothetical protein
MSRKEQGDKLSVHELQDYNGVELQDEDLVKTKGGTATDKDDMRRMGRTQELRVRFCPSFLEFENIANYHGSVTSSSSAS